MRKRALTSVKGEADTCALIEDGHILIRVAIDKLPSMVERASVESSLRPRYRIIDLQKFATEIVAALNRDEEDGSTLVQGMFDAAIEDAIDQSAFAIEDGNT